MPTSVPISKQLLLANSASSIFASIVNIGVQVWVIQYLLRRVPAEEFSILPVVMGIMTLIPIFTTVLTSGLARYVTEAYAANDPARITAITTTMAVACAAASVVLGALGFTAAWTVGYWLNVADDAVGNAQLMLGLLVGAVVLRLPLAPYAVGLYVRQRFTLNNAIQVGTTGLRAGLLMGLILGIGPDVLWVVVAMVVADLAGLLVRVAVSRSLVPALAFDRRRFTWPLLRQVGGFGLWTSLGQTSVAIQRGADPIILTQLATPVDVNGFYVGATIDQQIRRLVQVAVRPVEPALIAMHASGQADRLRKAYLRGGRLMMWIVLAGVVPLAVFREELMQLYLGPAYQQYSQAGTVLLLLLLCYPLTYADNMLARIAIAKAQIGKLTRWSIIIQAANLLLTLVLVGLFGLGAVGAASATLIVSILNKPLIMWPLARKLTGTSQALFLRQTLGPGLAPALAAALSAEVLRRTLEPQTLLPLVGLAGLSLVVYVGVCLSCLQPADRADLRKVLGRLTRGRRG